MLVLGVTGQANEDVTQHVLLLPSQDAKREWLFGRLVELLSAGSVLIFVTKKLDAEKVCRATSNLRLRCCNYYLVLKIVPIAVAILPIFQPLNFFFFLKS